MSKGITSTFSDHKKNKKWYMVSSGIAWLSGCVSVFAIRWLGVWSVVFIAIALVGLFGMTVFANRMSDMLDEVLNADSELVPNNQATDSDDSPNE